MPEVAAAQRRFGEALAALAMAVALLYAPWIGGVSPVAPHDTLIERFDLPAFPSVAWLESLASVCQVAALALAVIPAWPAKQRWAVLGAGVALAALYQIAIGRPSWWLYAYAFLSGAGLLAVLFFAAAALLGPHRQLARHLLGGLGVFIAFGVVTRTFLDFSSAQAEPALDWTALLLDRAAFGFSPSVWAYQAAPPGSALRVLLAVAYETLPVAMFAVFALESRAPRQLPFGLFRGLIACGFAAALLYAITPVTGPAYALAKAFPHQIDALLAQAPTWLATAPGQFAPRNAFPSFHLAWALMAALLCWQQSPPVRFDAAEFENFARNHDDLYRMVRVVIQERHDVLELEYERLSAPETHRKTLAFLGVDPAVDLAAPERNQGGPDVLARFTNSGEVVAALRRTRWAAHLPEGST